MEPHNKMSAGDFISFRTGVWAGKVFLVCEGSKENTVRLREIRKNGVGIYSLHGTEFEKSYSYYVDILTPRDVVRYREELCSK